MYNKVRGRNLKRRCFVRNCTYESKKEVDKSNSISYVIMSVPYLHEPHVKVALGDLNVHLFEIADRLKKEYSRLIGLVVKNMLLLEES